MLKQLNRLSIDADGRYANDAELKFIKNYIDTAEQRISAYEKVRDAEDGIIEETGKMAQTVAPKFFPKDNEALLSICTRDRRHVLRMTSAAMLFDEPDALRNGFLCWYRTIIKSFNDLEKAKVTYKILPEVIKEKLTEEEFKFISPLTELDRSVLTD